MQPGRQGRAPRCASPSFSLPNSPSSLSASSHAHSPGAALGCDLRRGPERPGPSTDTHPRSHLHPRPAWPPPPSGAPAPPHPRRAPPCSRSPPSPRRQPPATEAPLCTPGGGGRVGRGRRSSAGGRGSGGSAEIRSGCSPVSRWCQILGPRHFPSLYVFLFFSFRQCLRLGRTRPWQGVEKNRKEKRERTHPQTPSFASRRGRGRRRLSQALAQRRLESGARRSGHRYQLSFLLLLLAPFSPLELVGSGNPRGRKQNIKTPRRQPARARGDRWLRCTRGSRARSTPRGRSRRPRRRATSWAARGPRRTARGPSPSEPKRRRRRPGSAAAAARVAGPGSSTRRGATVTTRT